MFLKSHHDFLPTMFTKATSIVNSKIPLSKNTFHLETIQLIYTVSFLQEFFLQESRGWKSVKIRISETHILPTITIIHIIVQKSTVFQSEAMFHPEFPLKIFEILIICLSLCQSTTKEQISDHFKSFFVVKNHIYNH